MPRLLVLALAIAVVPGALMAQENRAASSSSPRPSRDATIAAGFGNALGWLGGQGEAYFAGDRISVFGGLGYTPEFNDGDPTGLTAAAGIRGYTGGFNHRGFLELSVSQVSTCFACEVRRINGSVVPEPDRYYGPGIQAGYQYVADGGFTVMASVGVGYAVELEDPETMANLAIGYTWR